MIADVSKLEREVQLDIAGQCVHFAQAGHILQLRARHASVERICNHSTAHSAVSVVIH